MEIPLVSTLHLTRHEAMVSRAKREQQHGHRAAVLWFTGLSGSGKSTLACALEAQLHAQACRTFVLDGDNIRHGLCRDLDFSPEARHENIRRIGEVAKLFVEAGTLVLSAFISPYRQDRRKVRALFGDQDFIEIYCQASLTICEQRDVKGLYQKARQGLIPDFTGVHSPYEVPESAELVLDTANQSVEQCVLIVLDALRQRGIIPES
jgi:adenylylsulfate kinase